MVRFLVMVLVCSLSLAVANAQDQPIKCTANKSAPPVGGYQWPEDTRVKVYFVRNLFTAEQKAGLLAAMALWTKEAATAGAGVSFEYAGEVDSHLSCPGCLTVARREIYKIERKHYAYFYPLKVETSGRLVTGLIDFDFATTNPRALQAFMAHEMGHGMGLWDCPSCNSKATIMGRAAGINRDHGLLGPSICDRELVKRIYEGNRQMARNAGHAKEERRRSIDEE